MATATITPTNSFSYYSTSVGQNGYVLGTWQNSTGQTVSISDVKSYVGTGSGSFTAGIQVQGNGQPISLRMYIGSTYTGYVTVSNVVTPSQRTATYSQMEWITLSFTTPVTVANGSTITLTAQWTGGSCLCLANSTAAPQYEPYWSQLVYSTRYNITYNLNGGAWPGSAPSGSNVTNVTTVVPVNSYTLTFDANGGSVSPSTQSVPATFRHWNTAANDSGTSYASESAISSNLTLYAIWGPGTAGQLPTPTRNYILTYNANNGPYTGDPNKTIPASFKEWNSSTSGSGTVYTSGSSISSSITIHAIWNPTQIGELPQVSNLLQWNTLPSGTGTTVTYQTMISQNMTIYAIWQDIPPMPDMFTVTFMNKNIVLVSGQVGIGQSAASLAAQAYNMLSPSEKQAFKGWSADYTNITYDLTVYAMYERAYIWIMTSNGWVPYSPEEV